MYRRVEMLIAACFYYSGLVKFACWWTRRSRKLVILCYHHATGGDLRQHMLYLRRHYRVLHLEAALEELYTPYKSRSQQRDQRTPLVMAFDDGYHDHYTHGAALASELQVPITIFLVPGYIESGSRFWWHEGDFLAYHAQVNEATLEGQTYHLDILEERKALANAIDSRVRHSTSVAEREEFLISVRKTLAVPSAIPVEDEEMATLPLSWDEVQEMEKSEWVSFGAHTMHHPILAYLANPAEVQYEVSECRDVLERQLGHPVRTFAYPVGKHEHIGENGLHAVQEAGYDWALITIHGFNTLQTDPHLLHRIVVDVDQHWLMIAAKASGAWDFCLRLCRMPITLMGNIFRQNSNYSKDG